MRGVRGVRIAALLVALGLTAAACGGGNDDNEGASSGGGDQAKAQKVGIVYDIGGRGDKSFNDSAYAGLQAAQKEQGDKLQAKDVEPNPDGSNRKELLDGLADEGYGLIFGIGFLFSQDIAKSATENPDTQYAVIDGFDKLCTEKDKNLLCIGFKEEEGSFLVGAAAALKTKSNTVGFVGGQQGQGLIEKFQAGYEAGVKYIGDQKGKNVKVLVEYAGNTPEAFRNPAKGKELALKQIGQGADVIYHASGGTGAGVKYIADQDGKKTKVLVDYAGNTPEAFRNPAKGKELALKQIGQGADVIYHASGGTGAGVIATAADKKIYAIGVDSDQSLTASPAEQKWILTSMLKRVDNAVQQTIGEYVNGTEKGGIKTFGLKDGGIDYAQNQYNKELLGDIPTTLDELKQKIIDGEIKVPTKPA
ncbi:MAG TPA: BMP family ABC transporter substrate-binding protein [Actinomycetota bacterium]|nr:BMP family ABC transporter substrate-binding protein [Actinomycetota bacterium]